MAALPGVAEIVLHAQRAGESFFRKRGCVPESAPFKDQGVPHLLMLKPLVR